MPTLFYIDVFLDLFVKVTTNNLITHLLERYFITYAIRLINSQTDVFNSFYNLRPLITAFILVNI